MCGCAAPFPGFCSWPGKRRVVELQGQFGVFRQCAGRGAPMAPWRRSFPGRSKTPESGVHVRLCSPASRIWPLAWKKARGGVVGAVWCHPAVRRTWGTDYSLAQELSRPEQHPGTGRPCAVVQPRFRDFAPGLEKGAWWSCRAVWCLPAVRRTWGTDGSLAQELSRPEQNPGSGVHASREMNNQSSSARRS
ncbi:hypothetical protein Dret_1763 [Desulfohalobium retbaense DSM 5692]|uniref:Uncharacterized protein n=1 Tax=Desulfohalobium retbaense (strain ATCC 49708 / DSM 5692 / JCM 16813 / HR100) TaxID=485915 RepID=C8X3Q0_DESRD|nr:hypothetical protein Dret_1763 [Desulfohalobium retbaense DSM 5692]